MSFLYSENSFMGKLINSYAHQNDRIQNPIIEKIKSVFDYEDCDRVIRKDIELDFRDPRIEIFVIDRSVWDRDDDLIRVVIDIPKELVLEEKH